MQNIEGKLGRIFMIRLDEGDEIPAALERFAAEKNIRHGFVILLGGIDRGRVVVGPRQATERPLQPLLVAVDAPHEIAALGVLAPDVSGKPVLHIHGACGRAGAAFAGCLRPGVSAWLTAEAILYEMVDVAAVRVADPTTGVMMLEISSAAPRPSAVKVAPPTPAAMPISTAAAPVAQPYSELIFLFESELK